MFGKKLKARGMGAINSAQGRILFVLWQKDGISITELARKTSLEKSTLTAMLDRLERRGFLKRVRLADDRRKILIVLTDANARLKRKYEDVSAEMVELFYAGLAEADRDRFEKYLRAIYANLEKEEKRR